MARKEVQPKAKRAPAKKKIDDSKQLVILHLRGMQATLGGLMGINTVIDPDLPCVAIPEESFKVIKGFVEEMEIMICHLQK